MSVDLEYFPNPPPAQRVDAVVIGGGAAGLNGALMLARARRSVVVVDSADPRNAPADGVHGLLGYEGTPREARVKWRTKQ